MIEEKYKELCATPSDIWEHLPTLKSLTEECESVCEMGVRYIVSTYAFLAGKPKRLLSLDINDCNWKPLQEAVEGITDFEFRIANTLNTEIEEVDLLFIDTLHNYDQLKKELALHGNKAKKYLVFHDTTSFAMIGESYDGKIRAGIWPAIHEFLLDNPHWELFKRYTNNNGLTILKKIK